MRKERPDMKIRYEYLKKHNICTGCAKNISMVNNTRCFECLNKRTTYYKKISKNGKCTSHPQNDIVSGSLCQICIDRRLKLKNNGKCRSHPNRDVVFGKTSCKECLWMQLLNKNHLTDKDATNILEKQNYTCPWTGRKLEKGINASPDHIIPINGRKNRNDRNNPLNNISNIQFVDIEMQFFKKDKKEETLKKLIDDIIKNRKLNKENKQW